MHSPTCLPSPTPFALTCLSLSPAPHHTLRSQLIRRERECEIIDRKLVKEVLDIFVEMGGSRNSLEVYVTDFEDMLLSVSSQSTALPPPPTHHHSLPLASLPDHRRLLLARELQVGRGGLVPGLHV